ncbi:MAG: stage V sporulation protein SpoVM [Ruminococcus sp.]|nr:stage V sporulation protein SpoVM [Ruminococcus sp.]
MEVFCMKVVVVKSPKLIAPVLRLIFKVKKEREY